MARPVLDDLGNLFDSGYAHLSCFRKAQSDMDKAEQRWASQGDPE